MRCIAPRTALSRPPNYVLICGRNASMFQFCRNGWRHERRPKFISKSTGADPNTVTHRDRLPPVPRRRDFGARVSNCCVEGAVMRSPFGNSEAVAREIQGHFRPERDVLVPPRKFGVIARALFSEKAAFHISAICKCSERQAKRYLSGEDPAPWIMARYILDQMYGIE